MTLSFWQKTSSKRKRIFTVAAFFLISVVVTSIGTSTPLSRQEADEISQDIEQVRANISIQYIFGNNLLICLVMFIPVVGPAFGLYALYNTGVVIAAQIISASTTGLVIPPLLAFLTLFLFPFTWLEFISYSIGFAESIWFIRRSIQGLVKKEIRNAAILIAIVTILLLAGAVIEYALLQALGA